jgi:hypothetical protein
VLGLQPKVRAFSVWTEFMVRVRVRVRVRVTTKVAGLQCLDGMYNVNKVKGENNRAESRWSHACKRFKRASGNQ